ncbi:MAG: carbon-nitrogen hydrolase family protein [Planctomycetes bacterium]|nr:carbon-nitrogen hydrolase family protein [Planctomycetota bacterium]
MNRQRQIRLAAGQMRVEGGQVDANLNRAVEMIAEAGRRGCDAIVLPECLDVGWTYPESRELSEPISGPRTDRLGRAAARANLTVVAGLTERDGHRVFNSAVLIGPDGRVRLRYRKINVLQIAQNLYEIGDRLGVVRMEWATIGMDICSDNFPNSLDIGRTLGRMGAELIASPCAWAVDADHDNSADLYGALWRGAYGELARQFQMVVVGASNIGPIRAGPWAGRKCIGCSLIVDATGQPAAVGPYDSESLIVADVAIAFGRPRGTAISGMM